MRQYVNKRVPFQVPKRMEISEEIKNKLDAKIFPKSVTDSQKKIIYRGMEDGWFVQNIQPKKENKTMKEELKPLKEMEKYFTKVLDCLELLGPDQHALLEQDYLIVNEKLSLNKSRGLNSTILYEELTGVENVILEGSRVHYEEVIRLRASIQFRIQSIKEYWNKEDLQYLNSASVFAEAFSNAFPPPEHKISNAENSLFRKLFIVYLKDVLNKYSDPKRIIEKLIRIYN